MMKLDTDVVYLATCSFTEDSDNKTTVYLIGIYTTEEKALQGIEKRKRALKSEAKYFYFESQPINLNMFHSESYIL